MNRKQRLIILVAILTLAGGWVVGIQLLSPDSGVDPVRFGSDGSSRSSNSSGSAAPEAGFEMFDGSSATLADYRGSPLVVNFWASWCPPCVAEMPEFEEVHRAMGDRVVFLGMNTQDTPQDAARIVERTGVTYDLARDPGGEMFRAFEVLGMPSTFFISPEGRVVDRHTGALTKELLQQKIEESLLRRAP